MSYDILIYVFCILTLLVLILGIKLQGRSRNNTTTQFTLLVSAAIFLISVSIVTEILEGKANKTAALYITNLLGFFCVDILMCQFARYLNSLLEQNPNSNTKMIPLIYLASVIRVVVILIIFVIGKLFSIVDGCFVEEELASVPYYMTGAIILIPLGIIIQNKKCFTTRQFVVVSMYLLLPVTPVVIESFTNFYCLTPMSITLSLIMVYVLLQDDNIESAKLKQALLEEVSSKDQLTNINNRRAYYNTISKIEPQDKIGVVFCDINGLKYTNDHFGHNSGDVLIKRFANLLTNVFRDDDVYRISGDEFVVIVPDISEDMFADRLKMLEKAIVSNDKIASFGKSYGNGSRLEHLINEAESSMYDNKQQYYKEKEELGESHLNRKTNA